MTRATPEQLIILPRNTFLPLVTGIAVCIFVLAFLFSQYLIAAAMFFVTSAIFVYSAQKAGQRVDHGSLPIGRGEAVPPHTEVEGPPPWYALILTLAATGTILVSLIYGTFYNWLVGAGWPPAEVADPGVILPAAAALSLIASSAAARFALAGLKAGGKPYLWIAAGGVTTAIAVAVTLYLMLVELPDPWSHAYAATSFMLLGYLLLHAYIGGLFVISNALRTATGFVSPRRTLDLRLTRIWQDYTAVSGILILVLVLVLPALTPLGGAGQ